jgi:hypothetical protein
MYLHIIVNINYESNKKRIIDKCFWYNVKKNISYKIKLLADISFSPYQNYWMHKNQNTILTNKKMAKIDLKPVWTNRNRIP